MTKVENTRELPLETLRCFRVTNEQAERLATQYQVSWFYPLDGTRGYLYVLDSEHKEKIHHEQ